jgi:hypothetical protein
LYAEIPKLKEEVFRGMRIFKKERFLKKEKKKKEKNFCKRREKMLF